MLKATRAKIEETSDADLLPRRATPSIDETPALKVAPSAIAAPSVPVMTGTIFHALDEKGRVIIPAKMRPSLTEQFWMMLDDNDNVAIYNYQTGLDVLEHCEQMMSEHPGDEDIAAAVERITGTAELVTVEGNWRVQVSELLRFHAQLDKEIVTVGVLNHAVIWSRERWEAAQAKRLQSQEVRRAQAEMLRAAASGIKKKAHEQAKEEARQTEAESARYVEEFEPRIGRSERSGSGGGRVLDARPGDVDATGRPVKAAASSGDGKRSPRVLTLSQLGR